MTTYSPSSHCSRNDHRNVKDVNRSHATESRIDLGAGLQVLHPLLSEQSKVDNPLGLLSLQIGRMVLAFHSSLRIHEQT